jgi:hypothetical protein
MLPLGRTDQIAANRSHTNIPSQAGMPVHAAGDGA